jgi:beta-lactamase regulating signal transducer with metallopeptidase domain
MTIGLLPVLLSDYARGITGIERISRVAAESVVSGLWQGVVLAVASWVFLRLVPRTSAAMRFTVWMTVFTVLALLPFFDVFVSHGSAGPTHRVAVQLDLRWSVVIAAVWMAASLVRLGRLIVSAARLGGVWRRAVPVDDYDAELVTGMRRAQLCTSDDVDRPSVIGFLSPRILIPSELFARLTSVELEQIVLHEVGHLRRGDDWVNLLQKIGLVLMPLNPALIWVDRRMCFERELACDDGVLRKTKAPKAYATCLTALAETRLGRRAAALSLGAWERQSELARRVHSILRRGEEMGRRQTQAVLGVLLVAVIGAAVELSRCPRFVSFSDGTAGMPVTVAGGSSAETNQPVVFRRDSDSYGVMREASEQKMGATHETLLKASMPMNALGRGGLPLRQKVKAGARKPGHSAVATRIRSVQSQTKSPQRQVQGWMVLSSWEETEQPRAVLAVKGGHVISASYAVVATEDGWLVFQL